MSSKIYSRIIGTGKYKAEGVLTNTDLEKLVDTNNDWILERTGIRERRVAGNDIVTSDMAAHALTQAVEMAGIHVNDLDMIICGTVTGDQPLPATAAYVQQKIGASNHCAAFDLSAACAGFIYGLSIADSFIQRGAAVNVGIVGVELLSRVLNFEDRNTCVLFGDGAGAVVLSADNTTPGILSTHLFTDGSLADLLTIPAGGSKLPASLQTVKDRQHYVHMEGKEVFRYAVKYLASAAQEAMNTNNISPDDVDIVVAHQANMRILEAVCKRIKIPVEKFALNIEHYGNTSSASIPIALDDAIRAKRIKHGDIVLMIALGGGISWGSALIKW